VSIVCRCTLEAAQSWLDRDDEQAIELANKRLAGEPIEVDDELIYLNDEGYQ
jgi:hypothetical protein